MLISLRDGIKLVGISIVGFCAVFVCTFFLNYYMDAKASTAPVEAQFQTLYAAQIATAKLVCFITGGVLCVIAVIMLAFYIKLFIDGNIKRFGLFKAMGYSDKKIALSFWVFGLSVFIGAASGFACGWAAMTFIYKELAIDGLSELTPTFHVTPIIYLVILPTLVFGALACLYAKHALSKNLLSMLKGAAKSKQVKAYGNAQKPFLSQMRSSVLRCKKSAVFFIAFSCFCFSAMIQMGASMRSLSSVAMGLMILTIGIVLSVTAMIMAVTTIITGNGGNIAMMKAFGYSVKERFSAVLAGYIPLAVLGFALGTVYQYGLLRLMVDIVYKDISDMVEYSFDVPVFFITLALFVVAYCAAMLFYTHKLNKVSVKQIMAAE